MDGISTIETEKKISTIKMPTERNQRIK